MITNISRAIELINNEFDISESTLHAVVERYKEPNRFYHGIDHIEFMLGKLFKKKLDNVMIASVALSVIYHDAIYDPFAPSGMNEMASAKLLIDEGIDNLVIGLVASAIVDTVSHSPTCKIGEYLCALDLDHLINPSKKEFETSIVLLWLEQGKPDWIEFINTNRKFLSSYHKQIGGSLPTVLSYLEDMRSYNINTIKDTANGTL